MERIIPLFPLPLVVFPNSLYPLHIFEERYKLMVNNAIKHNVYFGIVPVADEKPTIIGTTVQVFKVTNKYANGEFDIIVKGGERFKIIRQWDRSEGYMEALIETYDDRLESVSFDLVAELERKFKELMNRVNIHLEDNFWINLEKARSKSFKIAEKSGLNIGQQIELLAKVDEQDRVSFLIDHLDKIQKFMTERSSVMNLIMHDGYVNS